MYNSIKTRNPGIPESISRPTYTGQCGLLYATEEAPSYCSQENRAIAMVTANQVSGVTAQIIGDSKCTSERQ